MNAEVPSFRRCSTIFMPTGPDRPSTSSLSVSASKGVTNACLGRASVASIFLVDYPLLKLVFAG